MTIITLTTAPEMIWTRAEFLRPIDPMYALIAEASTNVQLMFVITGKESHSYTLKKQQIRRGKKIVKFSSESSAPLSFVLKSS